MEVLNSEGFQLCQLLVDWIRILHTEVLQNGERKKKTKKENKTNNHYHLHTVYDLLEEIPFHLGLYDSAN